MLPPPSRYRELLPLVTGVALAVLAALAFGSTGSRNDRIRQMELGKIREELGQQIASWEKSLAADLDRMVSQATNEPGRAADLQRRFRGDHRWFDSLYVWRPQGPLQSTSSANTPPGEAIPPGEPQFVFPVMPPITPSFNRCAAPLMSELSQPDSLPARFKELCRGAPIAEQVVAADDVARQLEHDGQAEAALAIIDAVPLISSAPIEMGERQGVPAVDQLTRRMLRAQLLFELDRQDEAQSALTNVLEDTIALDAPKLESALFVVEAAFERILEDGRDLRSLRPRLRPCELRLDVWRTVQATARNRSPRAATEGARFVYDPSGDNAWTMYYVPAIEGGVAVVLHLSQPRLVEDFLRDIHGALDDHVVVRDIGRDRFGASTDDDEPAAAMRFSMALNTARVTVTRQFAEDRIQPLLDRWWTFRNFVTLFCIVLGYGALGMFASAERQHRELLRRQREFTTRVTHELKTPLAGIKVMAENLAAGAWRDDNQRRQMADRIVQEADRLTSRVNEVLQLSNKRELPTRVPFDVEELLLEAVDEWGPRYEESNIQLQSEADPIDAVTGDPKAIRDAINCLLDNAYKYRREDVESKVWLNARQDGSFVEIEVVDNGLGVPPAHRQRIFQTFTRIEGDNRGKAGGHGLGLAQVASIVAAHHGTVRCEDGVDGGARFTLRLPLSA